MKKYLLAEAFQEIDEEGREFNTLDNQGTLYKAMQVSFRGSDTYPKNDFSHLKLD